MSKMKGLEGLLHGRHFDRENASILPVNIIDMPVPTLAERQPAGAVASCEVEIEIGKRRVRLAGHSS